MQHSTTYTFGFAALVCLVCSVLVAGSAVSLRPRQELNAQAYRYRSILAAADLIKPGEALSVAETNRLFESNIRVRIVNLETGAYAENEDQLRQDFSQREVARAPETSTLAPPNKAKVTRLPRYGAVYQKVLDGQVQTLVLPVWGKGLWSTLYGFLAIDTDGKTIQGISFYEHAETPGLGGEIDNPRWQAQWEGKMAYREGQVAIEVVKGSASGPTEVDGLSGATLTSRGVSHLVRFWLGDHGFGPYLEKVQQGTLPLGEGS